jgi:hypothetical protein
MDGRDKKTVSKISEYFLIPPIPSAEIIKDLEPWAPALFRVELCGKDIPL